jgi:hypothetical protein
MCTLKPIDLNTSCYPLFFILKIFNKANPLHRFAACEPCPAPESKRDYKYYYNQRKLKTLSRKKDNKISLEKFRSKKTLPNEETIHIPQLITLPSSPVIQSTPVTGPLFSIGTYVSIIPDTSQRGYKCNRIQGRISGINLSPEDQLLFTTFIK